MVSAKRLSGINPLAYIGVEPNTPAPLFVKDRSPTINDYQNFNIGTFWLVSGHNVTEEIWMLVALEAGVATWVQLYPGGGGGGGANTFPADVGVANEAGGVLNIFGDTNIVTTGAGNTITLSLAGSFSEEFDTDSGTAIPSAGVVVIHGGTNIGTTGATNVVTINLDPSINLAGSLVVGTTSLFTGNAQFDAGVKVNTFTEGVVQSDISGNLFSDKGTDGQVLIGASASAPAWANITSVDSSVTITNGPNAIDLSATGGGGGGTNCAFFAYQPNTVSIGAPTTYTLGTQSVLTEGFDVGGNFFPGDGIGGAATFTAPVTGKYYLQLDLFFSNSLGSTTDVIGRIITPTRTYENNQVRGLVPAATGLTVSMSVCADLSTGDVVTFEGESGSNAEYIGLSNGNPATFCSGFLVGSGATTASSTVTTIFDASGTWNKNVATQKVEVYGWNGGGGGQSGACGNSSGGARGGGGGGNYGYFFITGPAAAFGVSQTITIGAGGAGGASISGTAVNGTPGANGGISYFGILTTQAALDSLIVAGLRPQSGGGQPFNNLVSGAVSAGYYGDFRTDVWNFVGSCLFNPTPAAGTGPGTGGNASGGFQGKRGTNFGAITPRLLGGASIFATLNTYPMPCGGGGGAGINFSSNSALSGGVGGGHPTPDTAGNPTIYYLAGGTAGIESGVINGGPGDPGSTSVGLWSGGCGGGGGGNQFSGSVGGNGGDGGFPGGGGGGGGASTAGFNSGSGGNGANGRIIVIEYL
jgi:hypothetical protein